jgi:hypothetical protein
MDPLQQITRRHFFKNCGVGVGSIALASLLAEAGFAAPVESAKKLPALQYPQRAKNVIYLFMAGGPSQLELFDYKPKLIELNGKHIPDSYLAGKRFAFMDSSFKERTTLLGTRRKFERYGKNGTYVSDAIPHIAKIVDEIAVVKTVATDVFNHAPAKLFMNTGSSQFGRPSMGAWVSYGIGSECKNLPGFVVLLSGPRGPRGGAANWGSGFLPTVHQGVPFRSSGDPIVDLSSPDGITDHHQRDSIDVINALNGKRLHATGDAEIQTRISQYEMAYRMQTSAPELTDLHGESKETLDLYGVDPAKPSFAKNCLLARRLVERGVRFIQLYHTNWDSHGGPGETLETDFVNRCKEVDQASAALVTDLKQRGLLKDTLVIWGGEFGRTPMGENRTSTGRNHHIDSATMWFAGGGVKPGITVGETDELGFNAVEDGCHVHDIHATILHLLGLEHTKLTFRFQGRDFRLTDVKGRLIDKLLA